MQLEHGAALWRRQLDHRLVGLHLEQGLVLGDGVALGDQPLDHPPLVDALADIRKIESERHSFRPPALPIDDSKLQIPDWVLSLMLPRDL